MKHLSIALGLLAFSSLAHADILWNQDHTTGTNGGSWVNQTASQNFADLVTFSNSVTVNRFVYYTNFDPTAFGTMHVKLLSDSGGAPGSVLDGQDITLTSWSNVATGINEVILDLTTPWALGAGSYWVGASGNGFEAAQLSVVAPGDGLMAQFNGTTYSNLTNVGDQMFRLEGTNGVPEPASLAVLSIGAFALIRRKRK